MADKHDGDRRYYVMNDNPKMKTDLVFTFTNERGVSSAVTIYHTFIPQDFTNFVTRAVVETNPNVRRAENAGYIRHLTDDEAAELLKGDDARAEQHRILKTADLSEIGAEAAKIVPARVHATVDDVDFVRLTSMDPTRMGFEITRMSRMEELSKELVVRLMQWAVDEHKTETPMFEASQKAAQALSEREKAAA